MLVATLIAPAIASACPYCAGREGDGAFGQLWLLAGIIAAPFLVAGVAFAGIRSALAEEEDSPP